MKCCAECEHAILDEQWGEYKCKVVQHKIYEPNRKVACKDYKHGKPEIKKEEE